MKEDSSKPARQQSLADVAKPSCALVTLIVSKANSGKIVSAVKFVNE